MLRMKVTAHRNSCCVLPVQGRTTLRFGLGLRLPVVAVAAAAARVRTGSQVRRAAAAAAGVAAAAAAAAAGSRPRAANTSNGVVWCQASTQDCAGDSRQDKLAFSAYLLLSESELLPDPELLVVSLSLLLLESESELLLELELLLLSLLLELRHTTHNKGDD
jgi:hypothetical protein